MKKILLIFGFILCGMFILSSCSWIDDGVRTAHQEYDPSAMLKKYETFVNLAASIDKMDQDVANSQKLRDSVRSQFEADYGKNHKEWDVMTKQNFQDKLNLMDQMTLATVSQRNGLVRDYNQQTEKFNWEPFNKYKNMPPHHYDEIK